jgi:hypothetical protein
MASSSIWERVSEASLKRLNNLCARGSDDCGVNVMTYSSPSLAQLSAGADVLSTQCGQCGFPIHLRTLFRPAQGTADPTTAEQTRLRGGIRIKHTCLPGGNPIVAILQQNLATLCARQQRGRLRRRT